MTALTEPQSRHHLTHPRATHGPGAYAHVINRHSAWIGAFFGEDERQIPFKDEPIQRVQAARAMVDALPRHDPPFILQAMKRATEMLEAAHSTTAITYGYKEIDSDIYWSLLYPRDRH